MTDKKWTPGPWGLISDADDDWGLWSVHNAKNPLDHVCDVADYPNARLIAAAPDLYDALEVAEESIVAFAEGVGVYGYSGASDVLVQVRAAMAKARGET
jgi:hypothetical protein